MSSKLRTEFTCDVLVVGSGAAGLAAAVTAADAGLDVLVVEKYKQFGGTSAISGGWMWVPGNPKGAAQSGDTQHEARKYLHGLAGERIDDTKLDEFFGGVPDMINFFESRTAVSFAYPEISPDYSMLIPGAKRGGRAVHANTVDARILGSDRLRIRPYKKELTVFGVMPQIGPDLNRFLKANSQLSSFFYVFKRIMRNWMQRPIFRRGLDLGNGNALIATLLVSAKSRGVRLHASSEVVELVEESGRVVGAVIDDLVGRSRVRVKNGVILAAGGFSHSPELRRKYYDAGFDATQGASPMTPEHDGASARLAVSVGGAFDDSGVHPAAWACVSVFGSRTHPLTFPHLRGVGLPGIIAVNQQGKRFTNEANSYHSFGPAMVAASKDEEDVFAWLICDLKTIRKYGLGYAKPWPVPRALFYRNGYLKSGRTLAQLADRIGVPATVLEQTISTFNKAAVDGTDPEFGRGIGDFNIFKGDPDHKPNPSIGPLEEGPYFATQVRLGDLGTFAGIATGPNAQVIAQDGTPIAGLYAVGSAAASVFAGTYPGPGAHLGPAMTFGYIAGRAVGQRSTDISEAFSEGRTL
jgi:hypothetical protein